MKVKNVENAIKNLKTSVKSIEAAATILAGKTGYDEVEYLGLSFRRSSACASEFATRKNGTADISMSSAKKYIQASLRGIVLSDS